MDLKAFYFSLDASARDVFCRDAGTTDNYVRIHLVHRRRVPRPELMDKLLAACQVRRPETTKAELLEFFYSSGSEQQVSDGPEHVATPAPSAAEQRAA